MLGAPKASGYEDELRSDSGCFRWAVDSVWRPTPKGVKKGGTRGFLGVFAVFEDGFDAPFGVGAEAAVVGVGFAFQVFLV